MRAAANRRRKQSILRRKRKLLGGLLPGFDNMDGENVKLMPTDSVYSYFIFLGPIENKRNPGRFSWNLFLAWLLVGLSFCLQGVVLYAVFNAVVAGDVDWRNGIISLEGKSSDPFAPEPRKCNAGGSLCSEINGTFSCAPPSIQLAGRWDMLDLNSDGVWTREEVMSVREDLECQFAVDPLEVFNVFVNFLKKREDVIWLHPLVKSGKALHKHYFDFAKGDIIMCNYRNEEMCPNLLKRGFFDGPLADGTSPRVGKTIDSALNYCYKLLTHGGVCERSLPSTYSSWRKASEKQCFEQSFHQFVYKHPKTGMTKSLLEVDYEAVSDYEKGRRSYLFMVYKSMIIGLFAMCMFVELKDILIIFTWVLTFPSESDVPLAVHDQLTDRSALATERTAGTGILSVRDDGTTAFSPASRTPPLPGPRTPAGVSEGDMTGRTDMTARTDMTNNTTRSITIHGITKGHRITVGILIIARLVLAVLLTWVGAVFLLQDTDYVNLLLNVVGLAFVIEIANCLYSQLLSEQLREEIESAEPFSVPMASIWKGLWFRNPAVRDLVAFTCLLTLLICGMYLHYVHIAKPLSTALECTCLSQGDHCFEAHTFDKDFWTTYWAHDVPQIFEAVDKMKKQHDENDDQSEASDPVVQLVNDAPVPTVLHVSASDFMHKGLHEKRHRVTAVDLKTLDDQPVLAPFQQGHHKSHYRVTRLLNHHRATTLLNGPK